MRQLIRLIAILPLLGAIAFASIFGAVRGVIHDPQHRPIRGAHVTLKANHSDWTRSSDSNDNGEFNFASVPVGDYTVTVSSKGFQGYATERDRSVGHKSGAAFRPPCRRSKRGC
jgi:hypothetical protein